MSIEISPGSGVEPGAGYQELLVEFGQWLDHRRGLAPVTVKNYCWNAREFLRSLSGPPREAVELLDAATVTGFMMEFSRDRNTNSVKTMARSVRSFLRFAHATGLNPLCLWTAVPVSAGWQMSSLPKAVPAEDIQLLLAVAARGRFLAVGLRDYAILLVLIRLGLRRGEVAGLSLDDFDWRGGEITVVGKASTIDRLPLPCDTGEAIVEWVTQGRPSSESRSVFTSMTAPFKPLSPSSIGHIVADNCRLAGIARIGAHRFRHTLATEMLRAGASLPEVGQVLRHRSARSTAIYAKVDEWALRPLAQPWPGSQAATFRCDREVQAMVRPWPGVRS